MNKKAKVLLVVLLGIFIVGSLFVYKQPKNTKGHSDRVVRGIHASDKVLGIITTPTSTLTPTPTIIPTPTHILLSKKEYVIAAFGDSMVDTMGEHLEYLDHALSTKYPGTSFRFYNYGIGSQTVETGIGRWDHDFSYQTRTYPAITKISPDVIVLGSFSYNPFLVHDVAKHTLLLSQLVELAKKTGASVYLLNEIAPLYDKFGQGPHGPNMTLENAHAQADRILEQLETVGAIAKSNGVILIDAFTPTQVNGRYGNRLLVNTDGGIHPSIAGHTFVAEQIASTIDLK